MPSAFSFTQKIGGSGLTNRILPEAFYRLVADSLSVHHGFLGIAVDATEEDFIRQLLRLSTVVNALRRMLMDYDPALKELTRKIIEEDKYTDPDLETRKADRGELSPNFLDEVGLEEADWLLAQTLILVGQSTQRLPKVDELDIARTYSRRAIEEMRKEQQDKLPKPDPDESNTSFARRIVGVVEEQMKKSARAAQMVS